MHESPAARLQRAAETCNRNGTRLTEIRGAVLDAILNSDEPLGAYALLDRLKARHIGAAAPQTVYRALGFLLKQGLVHRIERLNAFVACCDAGAHPHPAQFLICGTCGGAVELEDDAIAASVRRAAERVGFRANRATVEIEGTCAACAAS